MDFLIMQHNIDSVRANVWAFTILLMFNSFLLCFLLNRINHVSRIMSEASYCLMFPMLPFCAI